MSPYKRCKAHGGEETPKIFVFRRESELFSVAGVGSRDEERLVRDLFRGYNKLIRPVENMTQKVEVAFGLAFIQLINVVSVSSSSFFLARANFHWWFASARGALSQPTNYPDQRLRQKSATKFLLTGKESSVGCYQAFCN